MQSKIFLCSFILSLLIFNVVAQDVDNDSDGDVDNDDLAFEQYKASLVDAVAILNKNLNTRDARDLQRRGWFTNVFKTVKEQVTKVTNAVVKPVIDFTNKAIVKPVVDLTKTILNGKRSFADNKALILEARDLSQAQCAEDVAKFREAKKAALQVCTLAKFPDVKCKN